MEVLNKCLDNTCMSSNELEIIIRQLHEEVKKYYNDTTAKMLLHDGKIAELCNYIKANLSNELRILLDSMISSGEINDIITSVISNEIELLQNRFKHLDYVNVKDLGAKGDGVSDDTFAFEEAIKLGVGKIVVPDGTYLITKALELNENTEITGTSYRKSIITFNKSGSFNFTGTSLMNNGTHKKFLTIRNLRLQNNDSSERSTPFINLICCDYVKIYDSWIYGLGKQLLLWECFDSRIYNTDIEWGGSYSDANVFGIELKSGDSYEFTNNIYFSGCRFESYPGTCIGTKGENTNKITFHQCKFESYNCLSNKHINITKASSIYFKSCFFAGDLGNKHNCIYLDQVLDFEIDGFVEHSNVKNIAYQNKKYIYASGSGKRIINITLNNKDAYVIDDNTYGIETYQTDLYKKGKLHVNNYENNTQIITSNRDNIATLEKGSTSLNYKCTSNGFIYVTMTGTAGLTNPQSINVINETKDYNLRLMSIGANYVTGFMPVSKNDVIKCLSNTSEVAYVTFFSNRE